MPVTESYGICTAGNYRNATDNTCYPCPVGQYQPQDLQDQCLSCNSSYSTSGTGTVNATGCIFFCPDGYDLKTPGTTTCTLCPRGTYRSNTDLLRFKTCQPCADSTKSTDNVGSKLASDCKITSHVVLPEAFTEVVVGALLLIALAVCCYCARRYIVKRKRSREERDQTAYSLQAHEPRSDKPGQARSHNARGE
ncbi:signal peptide, CUB and EGF-like domain-containing protein 1 isoform X2 [Haliotis rubra]|uniref:signal peptide, CUB and EGF-like domain-containing protein 1 isoform X2 n=1 Tax=Haliotis rubra TaxID=36100 RepID=UPI001EE54243|nr:signal peptide, CUB and EGF-like domain-containing protein 1 isoform X2 [Haliotis rubra]